MKFDESNISKKYNIPLIICFLFLLNSSLAYSNVAHSKLTNSKMANNIYLNKYSNKSNFTATARMIVDDSDLLAGVAAQSKIGDFILENNKIKVVIQSVGRQYAWGMFGGNIIDAAYFKNDGTLSSDEFGELSLFFNLGLTQNATNIEIIDDGSVSGNAVIVAEGEDDLFDAINLDAIMDLVNINLIYDVNADFPLKIRTTYTLKPNSNHVLIETEFFNEGLDDITTPVGDLIDSGGDLEHFIPNPDKIAYQIGDLSYTWGGFGESAVSLLQFKGFFGRETSYGYIPPLSKKGTTDSILVTVSGVSVIVNGTDSLTGIFTGRKKDLLTVPAQGSAKISRYFSVGRDIASITDDVYNIRGIKTGTLSGVVVEDGTQKPLSNVRVAVVKDSDISAPVTEFYTSSDGTFSGKLPAGDYGLSVYHGSDFANILRPGILEPMPIKIQRGNETIQEIILPKTGTVDIKILDGNNAEHSLLPAKVTFYAEYIPPPKAVMDVTSDSLGEGVARAIWLPYGEGVFNISPGKYTVVVTRGFEYDSVVINDFVVSSGSEPAVLNAILTKVLDTKGFVSADLHVHGVNSPDSTVTEYDRIATFLGAGVDIIVSTDHDYVTDFSPIINAMGVYEHIFSISGVETTPFNLGHFNVYPILKDDSSITGGALDWADAHYRPIDLDTGLQVDLGIPDSATSSQDNLSPPQIFKSWEKSQIGSQVHQVNHPRSVLMGYFTMAGLNLLKLGNDGETTADPANFRLYPGTDLFDPESITALEVQNNISVETALLIMNDWFGFLNLGYLYAGTCDSDTHQLSGVEAGYSRTYVSVDDDDISALRFDSTFNDTFATSINRGQITCGSGLYITTEIVDEFGNNAEVGELLSIDYNSKLLLKIKVQAPPWSDIDAIDVFANTLVYANTDNSMYFEKPQDLNPEYHFQVGSDFEVDTVPITNQYNQVTSRKEVVLEVPINFEIDNAIDTWLVVTANGLEGGLKPAITKNDRPFAFSNPIYIDVDGDGIFQAPGQDYVKQYPENKSANFNKYSDTHHVDLFLEILKNSLLYESHGKTAKIVSKK